MLKCTKEIIENSEIKLKELGINSNESEILILVSLMHWYYIVYAKTSEGYQEESVKLATEFFKK